MVNEFRQDVVSGQWVLISSLRAKRFHQNEKRERFYQTIQECVFEPERLGEVIARYPLGTVVIPNKYPAVQKGVCGPATHTGPFQIRGAYGFHELVVTPDHERSFSQFTHEETTEVLLAYRDRYQAIAKDECGAYITIMHNHGHAAGASVYHSHSQILSTPMVPPEVGQSLDGAHEYMMRTGKPAHKTVLDWEVQQQKRIVYENALFVALCPFASRSGYEVRIFPKEQLPYFEQSTDVQLAACADALGTILGKLAKALDDVDYNFYIHTAPVQREGAMDGSAYHWHMEVVPRIPLVIAQMGGFELATDIYINSFDPDDCARELREITL